MSRRTLSAALAALCFGLFAPAQAADPLVLQLKWLADAHPPVGSRSRFT